MSMSMFDFLKKAKTLDPFNEEDMNIIKKAIRNFGTTALRVLLRGKTLKPEQKSYLVQEIYKKHLIPNYQWKKLLRLFRTQEEIFLLTSTILSNKIPLPIPNIKKLSLNRRMTLFLLYPDKKELFFNDN